MLRLLIIAVILYGAYLLTRSLTTEYKKAEVRSSDGPAAPPPAPVDLAGLPPQLAPSLQAAQQMGPATFRKWIDTNRRYLQDPKLGDIELDYAVAVARQNSAEARETFRNVKARTPANSPLQPRLQRLARTFE